MNPVQTEGESIGQQVVMEESLPSRNAVPEPLIHQDLTKKTASNVAEILGLPEEEVNVTPATPADPVVPDKEHTPLEDFTRDVQYTLETDFEGPMVGKSPVRTTSTKGWLKNLIDRVKRKNPDSEVSLK